MGIGFGGDREHRAVAGVGDEHLRAAQDVVVAAADGGGANRLHVAAGVGLGEREAAAFFAARHRGQEIFFLRVGAVIGDDVGHDQMAVDDAGEGHPAARQFFHDAGVGEEVEAEAAVFGGDGGAEEAELAHGGDHRVRVLVAMFEGGGVGDNVAIDEAADGGDDFASECFIHWGDSWRQRSWWTVQGRLRTRVCASATRNRYAAAGALRRIRVHPSSLLRPRCGRAASPVK